jgi:hypothetical protein
MPAHRLTMRLTREILRLRLGLAPPIRHVARSCHVSPSTVCECLARGGRGADVAAAGGPG